MNAKQLLDLWKQHVPEGTPIVAVLLDGTEHHGRLLTVSLQPGKTQPTATLEHGGSYVLVPLERCVVHVDSVRTNAFADDEQLFAELESLSKKVA